MNLLPDRLIAYPPAAEQAYDQTLGRLSTLLAGLNDPRIGASSEGVMLEAAEAALNIDVITRNLGSIGPDRRVSLLVHVATIFEYYGDDDQAATCQEAIDRYAPAE